MAGKSAILSIRIVGDASNAARTMDSAGKSATSFADKASRAGKVAGKVLAVGIAAAGAAAYKATQAAAADELAAAKLADTLHKAAGATDAQVASTEKWITAQGKALGVSDDELRPALSKLAVATGSVGKAQKLATLAMDVAAGRGKSLESVTEALAKAQTGNLGGLSRLGVATKNAAGETLSLDQIQNKLAKTYSGAAATAADTTAGKQKILAVQMGELQEQIGAKLLPVMSKLATIGLTVVDWISKNTTVVGILIGVIASLLAITYAVGVAVKLYTTYTKLAAAAQWLLNAAMTANPIGLVVLAIVALTAAFVVAYKKSETFRRIVDAAFGAVKRVVVGAVSTVVGFVRSHWRLLLAILTGPIGLAVYAIAHNWQRIRDGAAAAWSRIKSVVSAAAGAIPRLISSAWSGLAGIARAAFDRARDAALSAFYRIRDGVSRIVGNVVDAVRRLPDRIVSAVGDLGRLLYNAGVDIIQGLLDGIGDKIGDLRDKLGDITDMIPDIKGPPARDRELLRENGRLIMDGLMSGFDDRQSRIRDKLRRLTGEIRSSITATTAQPITLDAPSLSAGSLANARGNVAYITVNGAVDPVSTARQIRELLEREATWTGRTVGVVA